MQLTFAQFKRMKPKYKRRLILVTLIALALCIGVLFGISKGIEALRVRLNTTTLDKITAANVLDKASMNKILEVMKQDDSANVLVVDSVLTMSGEGRVTGLTMNLTNLVSQGSAEEWRLTATEKKAKLRKVKTRYENLNAQRLRLMEFKTYYPALSRAASPQLLTLLTDRAPAGANGSYTFTDHFGNNLSPEYDSYLARGLEGVWVSRIGGVSGFAEGYARPNDCAPAVVSVEAVDTPGARTRRSSCSRPRTGSSSCSRRAPTRRAA